MFLSNKQPKCHEPFEIKVTMLRSEAKSTKVDIIESYLTKEEEIKRLMEGDNAKQQAQTFSTRGDDPSGIRRYIVTDSLKGHITVAESNLHEPAVDRMKFLSVYRNEAQEPFHEDWQRTPPRVLENLRKKLLEIMETSLTQLTEEKGVFQTKIAKENPEFATALVLHVQLTKMLIQNATTVSGLFAAINRQQQTLRDFGMDRKFVWNASVTSPTNLYCKLQSQFMDFVKEHNLSNQPAHVNPHTSTAVDISKMISELQNILKTQYIDKRALKDETKPDSVLGNVKSCWYKLLKKFGFDQETSQERLKVAVRLHQDLGLRQDFKNGTASPMVTPETVMMRLYRAMEANDAIDKAHGQSRQSDSLQNGLAKMDKYMADNHPLVYQEFQRVHVENAEVKEDYVPKA